ncbi:MAG: hypothetical protein GEU78_09625 [Actinobacteria bacterium]|nr:hypothetical protein [Actinomycetota bacterium]
MSQPFTPTPPPFEPQHTAPKRRRWPWIAAIVVAGGIGFGAGSGGEDAPAASVTPPVPAETVTAEPEVITETETIEVAPQACLDAIDYGEQGFGIAADYAQATVDAFYAAAEFDVDGITAARLDMEDATERMSPVADNWNAAKAECRGSVQ